MLYEVPEKELGRKIIAELVKVEPHPISNMHVPQH